MDGLEDQADVEAQNLVERLYTHRTVEISHSSRDSIIVHLVEAFNQAAADSLDASGGENQQVMRVETLIFRSGLSVASLRRLHRSLSAWQRGSHRSNDSVAQQHSRIRALEFVGLRSTEEVSLAIACAKSAQIERLRLERYQPPQRRGGGRTVRQQEIAQTVCLGVFGANTGAGVDEDDSDNPRPEIDTHSADAHQLRLSCLEVVRYPFGSVGAQILADTINSNSNTGTTNLQVLRLWECDLQSDSATAIAQIIHGGRSGCHLQVLDLSYNPLGSPLTREMTLLTLVNKGLKRNLSLQDLVLMGQDQARDGATVRTNRRAQRMLDRQLAINQFWRVYQNRATVGDHLSTPAGAWPRMIHRVSAKPSALFCVLQEMAGVVARI